MLLLSILAVSKTFAGSISGHKFNDLNGNGVDDSEPGLAGFRIILTSQNSPSLQLEDITDSNGAYSFADLDLGRYEVCEVAPVVTPPWIPTTPSCRMITLRVKSPDATLHFGNRQEQGSVGCTRTQSHWGNSPAGEALLVTLVGPGITLGNNPYTPAQLDDILDSPTEENALLVLAHQLIAAKLNILNSTDDSQVADDISTAEGLISHLVIGTDFVATSTTLGQEMISTAAVLDDFNNGRLNVPHCR